MSFSFDGEERSTLGACSCGTPYHEHGKERVYPDDGPAGSYHYRFRCQG